MEFFLFIFIIWLGWSPISLLIVANLALWEENRNS